MRILIRSKGTEDWQLVESASYKGEAELQDLLAKSPSLIPADELREGTAPFVLAVPEFGLPGSGQTDLLAVTSKGNLAVVECKLSANPEIKRKVVAQVLEYAAYLWEMSYDELNDRVQSRLGEDLADLVSEAVDKPDWSEDEFRVNVSESLKQGTFMLIIAVDEVNEELRRTIRFLNGCGNPKFSFHALEMRRFQRKDVDVLVPHIYGAAVGPPPPRQWDEHSFLAALQKGHGEQAVTAAKGILEWAKDGDRVTRVWWGRGSRDGSFVPTLNHKGRDHQLFAVWTIGTVETYFYWYRYKAPFNSEEKRKDLMARLNAIESISLPEDAIHRRPPIRLTDLADENTLREFLQVFDWVIQEIRSV